MGVKNVVPPCIWSSGGLPVHLPPHQTLHTVAATAGFSGMEDGISLPKASNWEGVTPKKTGQYCSQQQLDTMADGLAVIWHEKYTNKLNCQ